MNLLLQILNILRTSLMNGPLTGPEVNRIRREKDDDLERPFVPTRFVVDLARPPAIVPLFNGANGHPAAIAKLRHIQPRGASIFAQSRRPVSRLPIPFATKPPHVCRTLQIHRPAHSHGHIIPDVLPDIYIIAPETKF